MHKKFNLPEKISKFAQKFWRFTKHQKIFVLYLWALSFFLLVLPLIKISPVSATSHSVRLFSKGLFTSLLIILVSMTVLLSWNMSFKFKNFIIGYFGFKENDSLFNFGFLWIIATAFLVMGDAIRVVGNTTDTIKLSWSYYFIQLFLLLGLVLTLMSVLKHAKENSNKTKIVNVVDEDAMKDIQHKKSFKGLFDEEEEEEQPKQHHTIHEHHFE
ncbi:MAG: hypothetical protein ACD_80C00012G0021 [uncultured bacterium (gcode 4)]|uniref:Uncharacterized protein n=1 Tax=uncultured bacterium (gcode 4) TaxID=1234023 RepID=K1X5V0_9BACT|nr:MAG: hypothetical protein ACD_80C00012G0021 [uncultured bacterium (gcode 4)]